MRNAGKITRRCGRFFLWVRIAGKGFEIFRVFKAVDLRLFNPSVPTGNLKFSYFDNFAVINRSKINKGR